MSLRHQSEAYARTCVVHTSDHRNTQVFELPADAVGEEVVEEEEEEDSEEEEVPPNDSSDSGLPRNAAFK